MKPGVITALSQLLEVMEEGGEVFLIARMGPGKMDELATVGADLEDLEDGGIWNPGTRLSGETKINSSLKCEACGLSVRSSFSTSRPVMRNKSGQKKRLTGNPNPLAYALSSQTAEFFLFKLHP